MEFTFPAEPRELWDDPDGGGLRASRLLEFGPNELDKAAERTVSFEDYGKDKECNILY